MISVIYKKGVIVLFLLNCIFSKVFKCWFYIFSRFFYQAGSKPYSSQDPSTLVPHAAIAHTPFSSAQDDGEFLVTSHQYSDLSTSGLSEKCQKRHTIHIVPQSPLHYIKQFIHYLYKTPRRLLILCAVPSLLTPNSSLLTLFGSWLKCQLFRKRNTSHQSLVTSH